MAFYSIKLYTKIFDELHHELEQWPQLTWHMCFVGAVGAVGAVGLWVLYGLWRFVCGYAANLAHVLCGCVERWDRG